MNQKFFAQDVQAALSKDLVSIGLKHSPSPGGLGNDFKDTCARLADIRFAEQD